MKEQNIQDPNFTETKFSPLSLKLIIQLAAPHTWPAAILPVLFSAVLVFVHTKVLSLSMLFSLLCICILMQAAVNTINDYYDFVKGTDSKENQDDPEDAVLVYNNIKPKSALYLAFSFLGGGLILGVYVIYHAGWIPLAIGLIGALIILLYSAGKSPLSYLPVGELVSGLCMGGLIPLACYQALSMQFSPLVLLLALPFIIGIALIMFTNNICDIEKDISAKRKTSAVLLGHTRAQKLYHILVFAWIISILMLLAFFFTYGSVLWIFMLLLMYPSIQALLRNPLIPTTRGQAMATCLTLNIGFGAFYITAILFDAVGTLVI